MQWGWSPALDSDLYAVLLVLRLNFEQPLDPGAISWPLRAAAAAFMRSWNSLTASRRNVSHHYDLDEALFRACLDTDLHYSCAYFTGLSEPLEAAQKAKCEHIARKLCLRPGQKVLDIGCGWGGLALYLAQHYQVCVTGLTLSVEQLRVAKQRAEELGLQDQVDFQLQDYRQFTGRYDRVVSVLSLIHI